MAYTRFSENCDIYVYNDSIFKRVVCCGCNLLDVPEGTLPIYIANSNIDMIDHVAKHVEAGHQVPPTLLEALLKEDERVCK